MSINQRDLDHIRNEFEAKLARVNLDHMQTANAIASYGERFTGVEARIDAVDFRLDALANDIDRRFEQVTQRFDMVDERFKMIDHQFEQVNQRFEQVDKRFEQVDKRFEQVDASIKELRDKLDVRFGWQTFLTVALGALILFDDAIRTFIGL